MQNENKVVTCPKCRQKFYAKLPYILDSETDKNVTPSILDGTFFEKVCPHCGIRFNLYYTVVYKNEHNKTIVCYSPGQFEQANIELAVEQRRAEKNDEIIRVVTSPNAFLEKVRIFDMGLDDRVIEGIKLTLLETVGKDQVGDEMIREVLCWVDDNKNFEVTIMTDKGSVNVYNVKNGLYQCLEQQLKPLLYKQGNSKNIIDLDWAIEFMSEHKIAVL